MEKTTEWKQQVANDWVVELEKILAEGVIEFNKGPGFHLQQSYIYQAYHLDLITEALKIQSGHSVPQSVFSGPPASGS